MVEKPEVKPRQSTSRLKFLIPTLCCLNNSRPRKRTQLFCLCTSKPYNHVDSSHKKASWTVLWSLALTLILVLPIKGFNQRLVFAFLPYSFYFLFLLTILLSVTWILLCISDSPHLCIVSKCCHLLLVKCGNFTIAYMINFFKAGGRSLIFPLGDMVASIGYFKVCCMVIMSCQT